jgi:phosphate transport system protein
MSRHLMREIEQLKKQVLSLGALVEDHLYDACNAVRQRDAVAARRAIDGDDEVDQLEVELEEECLKVLALHQPVAQDLRFIIAVLKMNVELERIGDLATNVANRALYLHERDPILLPYEFAGMADMARSMLRRALDAVINLDGQAARQVWVDDKEVDTLHRQMTARVRDGILADPDNLEAWLTLIGLSRFVERIADHATNVAKDLLYMLEGEIVRHRRKEVAPRPDERPLDAQAAET